MTTCVAELFLQGWKVVDQWSADAGRFSLASSTVLEEDILVLLSLDDEEAVLRRLKVFVPRLTDTIEERAQLLVVLRAIDKSFLAIHPRSQALRGAPDAKAVPSWLARAGRKRRDTGAYFADDDFAVIARGPLARRPRDPADDGAETLADRFSSLTVAQRSFRGQGGRIGVRHVAFTVDLTDGVEAGERIGAERIVNIPLGEAPRDITLSLGMRNGARTLVSTVDAALDVSDRFHRGALAAGPADILMAPEFMVDTVAADGIVRLLKDGEAVNARLVAAGSGLTSEARDGLHWNETRILNGQGAPLWRQRKLWPAAMSRARALGYGMDLDQDAHVEEEIAAGHELVVGDVDGLGRILVLICQDLKIEHAAVLLKELQPDWVLVPVLDCGVGPRRWTHSAAYDLCGQSPARFVVGSSLSLARTLDAGSTAACLMGIGPREISSPSDVPRAFLTATSVVGEHPEYASLTWRVGGWQQTSLTVVAPDQGGAPPPSTDD